MSTPLQEKLNSRAYAKVSGLDQVEKNKKGQYVLQPKPHMLEKKHENLTVNIADLESKLASFNKAKEENEVKLKKAKEKESKESKGDKKKKKKDKKKNKGIIRMIFNDADAAKRLSKEPIEDDEEPEVGEYKETKEKKKTEKKSKGKDATTLDTGLGKRFSPIVSYLQESITEFSDMAETIEADLTDPRTQGAKSMYRSSQTANLITARAAKLRAISELSSVAKVITDLEMKQAKEKAATGTDDTKAINSFGIKMLRGGFDNDKVIRDKKNKKKKDKDDLRHDRYKDDLDYDDDDSKGGKSSKDKDLAKELANRLKNSKKIKFSAHEKNIAIEGTYKLVVVADQFEPEKEWKFVAVDKKGNPIKGFKDDYPGLIPKRKDCRMVFDTARMQVRDKNRPGVIYKLILEE